MHHTKLKYIIKIETFGSYNVYSSVWYFLNIMLTKKKYYPVNKIKCVSLPVKNRKYSVVKGPHVHKISGEHFVFC